MPDPSQQSAPGGDGAAAIQARLPGGSAALLRAVPDEAVSDPKVIATRRYRRRVLLALAALVAAIGLYWGSSYFFAYTDDAYVTSDLVGVAPWITGRIVAVPIVDNQTVVKGTLLAEIDPTPFRLSLASATSQTRRSRSPACSRPRLDQIGQDGPRRCSGSRSARQRQFSAGEARRERRFFVAPGA